MTLKYNKPEQTELRRTLRSESSTYEKLLWQRLKSNQLGVKFRRQYGFGPYIIDLYCPILKLAIEIDGESHYHDKNPERDIIRQTYIEKHGIRFLRFLNREIIEDLDRVLEIIRNEVELSKTTPL